MKDLIHKLLEEVDLDIKKIMLANQPALTYPGGQYTNWEGLEDPVMAILEWQKMRDFKLLYKHELHNNKHQTHD